MEEILTVAKSTNPRLNQTARRAISFAVIGLMAAAPIAGASATGFDTSKANSVEQGAAYIGNEVIVTSRNWREVKEESHKRVVFVEAGTSWCGYCKKLKPVMQKYNRQADGDWVLAHIDGDDEENIVRNELGIKGYPTVVAFWKGRQLSDRMIGWKGDRETKQWIDSIMRGRTPTSAPTTSVPTTSVPTTSIPTTSTTTMPGTGQDTFTNDTRYNLGDYRTVRSDITSDYRDGKRLKLAINMSHSCGEQIELAVTTPDGVRNVIKRSGYAWRCTPWEGERSDSFDMRSQTNGAWQLEASDNQRGHTGSLNSWTISFTGGTPSVGGPGTTTTTTTAPGNPGELPPEMTDGVFRGAINVTADNHDMLVESSKKKLFLMDFSKEGCQPCEELAPILRDKKNADNDWTWGVLDGTAYKDLWAQYGNPWFPTMVAFRDGKEVARHVGYDGNKREITEWIDTLRRGETPESAETSIEVSSNYMMRHAESLSYGKTVALRFHNDGSNMDSSNMGEHLATVAEKDQAKWVLANIDMGSDFGKRMANRFNVNTGEHTLVVLYQGSTWSKLVPNATGNKTNEELDAWITTMTSTYYKPGSED